MDPATIATKIIVILPGADVQIFQGGGGVLGRNSSRGDLGSKSAGIFIYFEGGGGGNPPLGSATAIHINSLKKITHNIQGTEKSDFQEYFLALPSALLWPRLALLCPIQNIMSKRRRGIQPTIPLADATLNDSNVNKFVLSGCVQCYVLKTNVANKIKKNKKNVTGFISKLSAKRN